MPTTGLQTLPSPSRTKYSTVVIQTHVGSALDHEISRIANGAIPNAGMLLKEVAGKVVVHATASKPGEMIIAKEDALQGNLAFATAYASGDEVPCHYAQAGDVLAVCLATSQTIVADDLLVSNGDGSFKKAAGSGGETVLCKALEAVTTTAAMAQIKVRVVAPQYFA